MKTLHLELLSRLRALWSGNRPPHGLILTGPKGIGKGSTARALARHLLDMDDASPDAVHPDMFEVNPSPDAATRAITVDQIRSACGHLHLTAARGGRRVCIIDAADEMTEGAANALLKTLEEPPANTLIILVCHAISQLPATIRSRCTIARVPAPEHSEAIAVLQGRRPDLSAQEATALIELADGSPGVAGIFADQDMLAAYRSLIELLTPTALVSGGLDRSQLHEFAGSHGKKETWEAVARLVQWMMNRACETAISPGTPLPEIVPGEVGFLSALARTAGVGGLTSGWTIIDQVIEETRERHLDQRYALMRVIMAVEFVARPRKAA